MNRRQMLFSATGAAAAAALLPSIAKAWTHGIAPATGFPLVAPTDWNGTPGSGVSPTVALAANGTYNGTAYTAGQPLYATRQIALDIGGITAAAMPALQWWVPSQIRGVGPTTIGVIADAKGLISHVDFFVEGATQPNVTSIIYTDTNINGLSRTRPFWGINVDCATAAAAHPTGVLRVYAKAYPVSGSMTPRTIGPLTIYPRAVAYDWDKTLKTSGGDYSTLAAALQGMKTALAAGAECGRITNYINGTLDWGWPNDNGFPWSKGYSCVANAPGVTATISRFNNSGIDAFSSDRGGVGIGSINDPWVMWTYVNNLEFRGAGLTVDRKNIRTIASYLGRVGANFDASYNLNAVDGSALSSGNFFFNGCNVTNTYGAISSAPHQLYWNDSTPPSIEIGNINGDFVAAFGDSVTCTHLVGGTVFLNSGLGGGAIFCQASDSLGTQHQAPYLTFGEYSANSPLSTEQYLDGEVGGVVVGNAAVTIRYVGSGGTDATLAFTTSPDLLTFDVTSGGTSIAGYPATFQMFDPTQFPANMAASPPDPMRWADIQSWLATNRPGDWTFSYPAQTFPPFWSRVGNVGPSLQPWPQHVKSAGYTVLASAALHSEYVMWNGSSGAKYENVIFWNNTVPASDFSTSFLNCSDRGNKDWSLKNNTFDAGGAGGGLGTRPAGSHIQFDNNTIGQPLYYDPGDLLDAYCSLSCNLLYSISANPTFTGICLPTNSLAGGTVPSGTGCVSLSAGALDYTTGWSTLFVNNTAPTSNFTPFAGRALASNTFTTITPLDAQVAARANPDAVGAWKNGGTAPSWPF